MRIDLAVVILDDRALQTEPNYRFGHDRPRGFLNTHRTSVQERWRDPSLPNALLIDDADTASRKRQDVRASCVRRSLQETVPFGFHSATYPFEI